jgi:uncharacterized membrane protein
MIHVMTVVLFLGGIFWTLAYGRPSRDKFKK